MPEGIRVLTEIAKGFAHREMRGNLIVGVQDLNFTQQLLKARQTTIARLEPPHICKVQMNGRLRRFQFERPLEGAFGFLESPQRLERHSLIVVRSESRRLQFKGAPVRLDRLLETVEHKIRIAEIAIRIG